MDDFAERFGERVQAAQEAYRQQMDQAGREQADRRTATEALLRHAEQRFQELARVHRRAVKRDLRLGDPSVVEQQLSWLATKPPRSLLVRADQLNSGFWWAWAWSDSGTEWTEVDVTTFSTAELDELIDLLADQEAWGNGRVPAPQPSADEDDADEQRVRIGPSY